jgi:hypothetical protein
MHTSPPPQAPRQSSVSFQRSVHHGAERRVVNRDGAKPVHQSLKDSLFLVKTRIRPCVDSLHRSGQRFHGFIDVIRDLLVTVAVSTVQLSPVVFPRFGYGLGVNHDVYTISELGGDGQFKKPVGPVLLFPAPVFDGAKQMFRWVDPARYSRTSKSWFPVGRKPFKVCDSDSSDPDVWLLVLCCLSKKNCACILSRLRMEVPRCGNGSHPAVVICAGIPSERFRS